MGEQQLKSVLQLAKNKFRKDKQTAIYAVMKGNVVQMVNDTYDTAEDLKKAISKYRQDGFYKVHSYLSV